MGIPSLQDKTRGDEGRTTRKSKSDGGFPPVVQRERCMR